MAIQDTEVLAFALDDFEGEDDYQIVGTREQVERGESVTLPVVERVDGGAWVLARVWIELDERS